MSVLVHILKELQEIEFVKLNNPSVFYSGWLCKKRFIYSSQTQSLKINRFVNICVWFSGLPVIEMQYSRHDVVGILDARWN